MEEVKKRKKLYWLLPIRSILFILTFTVLSLCLKKELTELACWWSIIVSIINILLLIGLHFLLKRQNRTYAGLINLQKGKTKVKQIVIMCIVILCVGMGGMYLSGLIFYQVFPYMAPIMISPIPLALAIINIFILPLSTALCEDGIYLGCGVNEIDNKYLSIIIPSFFFALQHSFIPLIWDMRYIGYRFLCFLPLTILICLAYRKNRNPLPDIIGHSLIDVATVVEILLTSAIPGFYDQLLAM